MSGPKITIETEGNERSSSSSLVIKSRKPTDTPPTDTPPTDTPPTDTPPTDTPPTDTPPVVIDDSAFLSYFNEKSGLELSSVDEISSRMKQELPEDVAAFKRFKEETGRGISDFLNFQRDFEKEDELTLIQDFIKEKNPRFDSRDVALEMKSLGLHYDEDSDEEEIEIAKLNRKKYHGQAVDFFSEQQKKYKTPINLETPVVPEDQKEAYDKFISEMEQRSSNEKKNELRRSHFSEETEKVFGSDFKGFEFEFEDGVSALYEVNDVETVKNHHMSAMNFIGKFLDEDGMLKNADAYHKAMYAAEQVDNIAKWAYEQGRTSGIESSDKERKNIDMSDASRRKPESITNGFSIEIEEDSSNIRSGGKLRIPSPKNR